MTQISCRDCGGRGGYAVSDARGEECGAEECNAMGCVGGVLHCDACGDLAVAVDDGIPACAPCALDEPEMHL